MKKNITIGIILVLVTFAVLAGVYALMIVKIVGAKIPPLVETISSSVARQENWQDTLTAVGSVNAEQGVMVSPEIAGTVSEIAFESGAAVNKGDLLVKLDTSSEEAQLRGAEAQVQLAKLNSERTKVLRAGNTVSQSELDSAEATLQQNQANADAIRATIEKKTVRAPFTGKLGIRLVNLGEQLDVGKAIVSLQSLVPAFVDFSLPQQDLSELKTGLLVRATTDAYPGKTFTGELTAINPNLDATTRSIQLRAKFGNADQLLRPGMFTRVEVVMDKSENVLTIPATAVLSAPYGNAVYIIEPQMTNGVTNLIVQQKFIRTGRTHGDFVSVESGLQPGDRVVTAGIFKLHNGTSVQENNDDSPKPSLTPNPPNS